MAVQDNSPFHGMAVESRPRRGLAAPHTPREGGANMRVRAAQTRAIRAPHDDRVSKFRLLAFAVGAAYAAYFVATVSGAPEELLSPLFSVFMVPVPFAVWWAYARAPADLRRLLLLLSWAATSWLVGSAVWYGYYFAAGSEVPEPPGTWDAFFLVARILVVMAIVDAMRTLISFRIAALDAVVICAATLALGAAFVSRGLEDGVSAASVFTLNRPVLGIVTLMLIVSAALGSWRGLPLSIVLLGAGEVALTVGSLVYSFQAIQGAYVDSRWADLGWAGGAALSILAASVIITGVDRPIRVAAGIRIPRHAGGSRSVLLVSLGALFATVGVACYGLLAEKRSLILTGLFASVSIGIAMALRARDAIRTAEDAYTRLDEALSESERARDELAAANVALGRANLELRTTHVAFADLLNLADERTNGRLRELIEDTGGELADLLEEELRRARSE
jgi:hypothetical protein